MSKVCCLRCFSKKTDWNIGLPNFRKDYAICLDKICPCHKSEPVSKEEECPKCVGGVWNTETMELCAECNGTGRASVSKETLNKENHIKSFASKEELCICGKVREKLGYHKCAPKNEDRPPFLWDKDTMKLAKKVGDSIRKNEATVNANEINSKLTEAKYCDHYSKEFQPCKICNKKDVNKPADFVGIEEKIDTNSKGEDKCQCPTPLDDCEFCPKIKEDDTPKADWEERITIVQARGKGEAKFRPVLYLDNEIQYDTTKLFSLIHQKLEEAYERGRQEQIEKINKELPKIQEESRNFGRASTLAEIEEAIREKYGEVDGIMDLLKQLKEKKHD